MTIITKICRVCCTQHTGTHEDLKAHFYVRADHTRKLFNTCRPCHSKSTSARKVREYHRQKSIRLAALTPYAGIGQTT